MLQQLSLGEIQDEWREWEDAHPDAYDQYSNLLYCGVFQDRAQLLTFALCRTHPEFLTYIRTAVPGWAQDEISPPRRHAMDLFLALADADQLLQAAITWPAECRSVPLARRFVGLVGPGSSRLVRAMARWPREAATATDHSWRILRDALLAAGSGNLLASGLGRRGFPLDEPETWQQALLATGDAAAMLRYACSSQFDENFLSQLLDTFVRFAEPMQLYLAGVQLPPGRFRENIRHYLIASGDASALFYACWKWADKEDGDDQPRYSPALLDALLRYASAQQLFYAGWKLPENRWNPRIAARLSEIWRKGPAGEAGQYWVQRAAGLWDIPERLAGLDSGIPAMDDAPFGMPEYVPDSRHISEDNGCVQITALAR